MQIQFLGYGVPYQEAMEIMRKRIEQYDSLGPVLLLLEHEDVITYTRQHGLKNLLVSKEEVNRQGITLVETDRGGDITFHGKGQLVGYPIMRLPLLKNATRPYEVDLIGYVRRLEEVLKLLCKELGVETQTVVGKTGIWVPGEPFLKLVSIGVGVSKGITKHGFALNIDIDYERFCRLITPCGLKETGMTSLKSLGVYSQHMKKDTCLTVALDVLKHLELFLEVYDGKCGN